MPKAFSKGKLFVISGPSGVGKDTLMALVFSKIPDLEESVSVTSRSPREGESEGINYYFQTKDSVEKMIKNEELLEWNLYAGNYYGTPKKFVEKKIEKGEDVLFVIDVNGAANVKKNYPEAKLIFIEPPSLDALKQRLQSRGTESIDQIERRLGEVKNELLQKDLFDVSVVNDNLESAANEIVDFIQSCK